MPMRLRSPCRVPGCSNLAVRDGYCEQHQQMARQVERQYDSKRGSSSQRGYSSPWQRLRAYKLRVSPLCEDCLAQGGKVTAATMVHHANPISEGGAVLPLLDELVSLCEACHDKRHKAS